MPGIEHGSVTCQASALPTGLSLWPSHLLGRDRGTDFLPGKAGHGLVQAPRQGDFAIRHLQGSVVLAVQGLVSVAWVLPAGVGRGCWLGPMEPLFPPNPHFCPLQEVV